MDSDKSNNDNYHVIKNKMQNAVGDPNCDLLTKVKILTMVILYKLIKY